MNHTADARLLDLISIDRELCSRSLQRYVELAWPMIEPARPYVDGWHLGAICEHLQAVSQGQIRRLLINIPPGCMKSLLACVFWPTWVWGPGGAPQWKWIYASYAANLSRRDALRSRRLIDSQWYQDRWPIEAGDEWTSSKYTNTRGGLRLSTSTGGQVTGDHADGQVADDPLKPQDVTGSLGVSRTSLDRAWNWWQETMATRLVNFETSARVIIMQRLHADDLSGRVLREGGYEHLCLPMGFDPQRRCATSIGFRDPRAERDELLWEARFPAVAVAQARRELGPRGAAAQLDQTPSPAGGAIFKRDWFRYYYRPGWERLRSEDCVALPERFDQQLQSWDCAFKGGAKHTGSLVGGQCWGSVGPDCYLLDYVLDSLDFAATCRAVEAMTARHPQAVKKLVEDAANGPAVVSALRARVPGFELVPTGGGKEARANACVALCEGGNVFLPHPETASWVGEFMEHLASFPAGSIDDDVDALTHALVRLQLHAGARYVQAMRNLRPARRA